MADPFSTVAAVVSFADVTIRACKGICDVVDTWKEAADSIPRLRQTAQNLESTLESLRLYVIEYESSKICVEQHQLLPAVVKEELCGISSDLVILRQLLRPARQQRRMTYKLKWLFNEKRALEVIHRLDSRQIAVTTGLQIVGQINGMKTYEQIAAISTNLQRPDTATTSQILEAQTYISGQLTEVVATESRKFMEQTDMLNTIRVLAEPISQYHVMTMRQLDSLMAATRASESYLQKSMAFQAVSTEVIGRLVRAELERTVVPTVERSLNSYKSSQHAQIEEIRKNFDQIILDPSQSSMGETPLQNTTDRDGVSLEGHEFFMDDRTAGSVGPRGLDSRAVTGSWSRSWRRSWTFRWQIGVLVVHVSASHYDPPLSRRTYEAFKEWKPRPKRHSYNVSMDFQPALNFYLMRGLSFRCESKQNQPGSYQICPTISTFAIISRDSKVVQCIAQNDIKGLQRLFEDRVAAPTDRTEDSKSMLQLASHYGYNKIVEFLLAEGADPFATDCDGIDCMLAAQRASLLRFSLPDGDGTNRKWPADYRLVTRALIRSGCDLDDAFKNIEVLAWTFSRISSTRRQGNAMWDSLLSTLSSWIAFLWDQGLDINQLDDNGLTSSTKQVLLTWIDNLVYQKDKWRFTFSVFMLCTLKIDTTVREPTSGLQALHILFLNKWSAKLSPHIVELGYVLIRYGGADIFATDYEGCSPSSIAYSHGWWTEWVIILDRCGLDPHAVVARDHQVWQKFLLHGHGDSSAFHTDHLIVHSSEAVSRRRPTIGDRLVH